VDEEGDVVGFAGELAQLGAEIGVEVGAGLSHDLLAAGEHRVVEHARPVLCDEHQVDVQVPVDGTATPDIGVRH